MGVSGEGIKTTGLRLGMRESGEGITTTGLGFRDEGRDQERWYIDMRYGFITAFC